MGYMGFGMRKEVYTRKPKKSFSHLKAVYGDNLERFKRKKAIKSEWSEKDKNEFREYIRNRVKRNLVGQDILSVVIYLMIIIIISLALFVSARLILY